MIEYHAKVVRRDSEDSHDDICKRGSHNGKQFKCPNEQRKSKGKKEQHIPYGEKIVQFAPVTMDDSNG